MEEKNQIPNQELPVINSVEEMTPECIAANSNGCEEGEVVHG